MKFLRKYHLPIIFVAILVFPTVNWLFDIWEFDRSSENRKFHDELKVDLTYLDGFPEEFESYYNDNFSFRTPLLDAYHEMKLKWFKVSPHPEKSLMGQNGWMYISGKEKEIYEGEWDFTDEQLKQWEEEWKRRIDFLDQFGVQAYWVICPMKYRVYPEYLPYNIYRGHEQDRVDQLKAYLEPRFPGLIIDPVPELMAVKDQEKVFYQTDNHWNFYGGYVTSKLLHSRIQEDMPDAPLGPFPEYVWRDSLHPGGSHCAAMGIKDYFEEVAYPVFDHELAPEAEKLDYPPFDWFPYKSEFQRHYVNPSDTSGLKLLMIRDSFGHQMIPFIKEPFSESLFIFDGWLYGLNESVVETYHPDVVVFMGLETHMDTYLKSY